MTTTPSPHATSLTGGQMVEQNDLRTITKVTADTFPILNGMSIKRIVLNPGAMRTPHWHANANELTYCVSGTSFVSVLDSYSNLQFHGQRRRDVPHRLRLAAPHREHR
jgi:oxalate decarboxylase